MRIVLEMSFLQKSFTKNGLAVRKNTVKMFAIILMDTIIKRFRLKDVAAASEAGLVVGHNEKTICK